MDTKVIGGVLFGAIAGILGTVLYNKISNGNGDNVDLAIFETLQQTAVIKNVVDEQGEANVIEEQLVRNFQHFGEEGQRKVMDSYVVIVGLGGVGSHCAISLARSGVKRIRILDFDRVTVSSLNRHACAVRKDVGRSKCEVLKQCIHSFSPTTEVEALETFYEPSKAELILGDHPSWGKPSFVVDAIDNIATKVDLIVQCHARGVPVIIAGGAGGKQDPTALRIDDISCTKEDQLARAVRRQLAAKGITKGIPMIYSVERNSKALMPLQEHQEEEPEEFTALKGLRVRTVPVIGPLPAIMGQSIAAFVLVKLAGEETTLGMTPDDIAKARLVKKEAVEQTTGAKGGQTKRYSVTRKNFEKVLSFARKDLTLSCDGWLEEIYPSLGLELAAFIWQVYDELCVLSARRGPPPLLRAVPWRLKQATPKGRTVFFALMLSTPGRPFMLLAPEFSREAAKQACGGEELYAALDEKVWDAALKWEQHEDEVLRKRAEGGEVVVDLPEQDDEEEEQE